MLWLSKVENIGAESETAAEDIEGMENADGDSAKMLNFCSNPKTLKALNHSQVSADNWFLLEFQASSGCC